MVKEPSVIELPSVDSYSSSEIEEAGNFSFPLKNYIRLSQEENVSSLSQKLRQERHLAWCECVLATYFDKASTKDICFYWSQKTYAILQKAWEKCRLNQEDLSLFALGKLGCFELNLSSDVDLMIISEAPFTDFKKVHQFQSLLQEQTEYGFAYRVDFDLRAGGRLGPLVSTYDQFEDFYGNYGSTLDRMAFIRLNNISEESVLTQKVLSFAKKFSFRRFVDHNLISDFANVLPQIHDSSNSSQKQFHLKKDPGGIRDIELYAHALQIIHGGKNPHLQESQTDEILLKLAEAHLLPQKEVDFLVNSYWLFRDLENLVQACGDQQTHSLPLEKDSSFFKRSSLQKFLDTAEKVEKITSALLGQRSERATQLPKKLEEQKVWLKERGLRDETIDGPWTRLVQQKILTRHPRRDQKSKLEFLENFLSELLKLNIDNHLAIGLLEDFLNTTRAKSSFLSLFNREPQLVKDLCFLLSISPYLGKVLSSRPELLDSFFFHQQEPLSDDFEIFLDQLSERKQLTELISSMNFLSQKNIQKTSTLCQALSRNADETCILLLEKLENQFLDLLTMGKWAGFEMGLRSDLDFIFVANEKVDPETHKLVRRFLNHLSARQKGGEIYSFDLRLRPSGNSGPLVTTQEQLLQYLEEKAHPWERQAYLRSRFLFSPKNTEKIIQSVLKKGFSEDDLSSLKKIRTELFQQNRVRKNDQVCLKYNPGGLVDIEFCAQIVLIHKKQSMDLSEWKPSTYELLNALGSSQEIQKLQENYQFLRGLEQLHQLCTLQSGSILDFSNSYFERICKVMDLTPEDLKKKISAIFEENQILVSKLDPIYQTS